MHTHNIADIRLPMLFISRLNSARWTNNWYYTSLDGGFATDLRGLTPSIRDRECYRLRARARTSVVFARSFVRRHSAVESIGGYDGFDAVRDVPGRRARRRGDVRGMRGAAGLRFGFGRNDSRRR